MAEFGVFIGWGSSRAGREAAGSKVFEETVAYCERLKAAGEIESYETVLLNPHGGDLTGFFLLRGDPEKLGRITMTPEVQRLTMRASACLEGVGIVSALIDAGVMRSMADRREAIADLI